VNNMKRAIVNQSCAGLPFAGRTIGITLLLLGVCTAPAFADLMDLTSLTKGASGGFTGMLNGIAVTGAITSSTPNFTFSPAVLANPNFEDSVIDGDSLQYSYSNIYAVASPQADQVGYVTASKSFNPATITVIFGSPIVDPIFQVANLDGMQYDFSPTVGLGGLVRLSGNGGNGDGLQVAGDVISDANTNTIVGQSPSEAPFTSGARSAYGSIELLGSFDTLTFDVSNPGDLGDGGSFTFAASPVPEPWSWSLLATFCAIVAIRARCRSKLRLLKQLE
jgi:hypothetical protein